MKVFEIKLKLYLLKDIPSIDALESIAGFLDNAILKSKELSDLHYVNSYKNYTFCSFYPLEKDRIHKKDSIYTVVIRTVEYKLADFFNEIAANHYNHEMKALTCEVKEIPKHFIEKVYTITPLILKDDKGYWRPHMTFDEFESRIKINLIKKYNKIMNCKLDEDFQLYNRITLLNSAPIKVKYKEIHLLGDKIELEPADNETAQKLIYMSLGTGVSELNARGYGFLNYQWR